VLNDSNRCSGIVPIRYACGVSRLGRLSPSLADDRSEGYDHG
jgi:hypothetical protein